jgi:hypothetical protein
MKTGMESRSFFTAGISASLFWVLPTVDITAVTSEYGMPRPRIKGGVAAAKRSHPEHYDWVACYSLAVDEHVVGP